MLVILISKYDIISVLFALNLSYRVVVTVWHPVSTRPIDALPYLAIFVYGYYGICGNFLRQFSCGQNPPNVPPLEALHENLHVVRAKQPHVPRSMRKTTLYKMATELSCLLPRKIFFWQISGKDFERLWNWFGKSNFPQALSVLKYTLARKYPSAEHIAS